MPDLKLTPKDLALGGLASVALIVAIAKDGADTIAPEDRAELDVKVPSIPVDAPPSEPLATDDYRAAVKKVRDKDPFAVDLLSPAIAPRAELTVGVSLPLYARLVGDVEPFGDAAGSFNLISSQCTDGLTSTWCEVLVRNTSDQTVRFSGFIHYEVIAP